MIVSLFISCVLAAFLIGLVIGAVIENRLVQRVIANADKLRAASSEPATECNSNPYAKAETDRTKYKGPPGSMWGPMPKDQGGV